MPAARAVRDAPTIAQLLSEARSDIAASPAIDHWQPVQARYDAEELMVEVTGHALTPALRRTRADAALQRRYRALVARRAAGEPVPHIRGRFDFRGLELRVRRGVFVPRASSELLAEEAVRLLRRRRAHRVAVDVATGSGPVALAIAHEVPGAEVWGVDISAHAITLCRANARRAGLGNVRFRVSDMLDALPRRLRGSVDALTIHPPYVARGEVRALPREIRDFEPVHSLTDGSDDGLGLVRRLAADAHAWLRPGGALLVEIGTYLSRATQTALRRAGLVEVTSRRDSLGVTRVVVGRTPH